MKKDSNKIKIACIGDSITYGFGILDRKNKSYPAVLNKIIGNNYLVRNFGVNGSTMLKKGNKPYWEQKELLNCILFQPHIIIIKLGTNDSKPYNWKFKDQFYNDYIDFLNIFKNMKTTQKIFICLPAQNIVDLFDIQRKVIEEEIIPTIIKISKDENLELIDLHTIFNNNNSYFLDFVHPNSSGAELIAKKVSEYILKTKF